MLLLAIVGYYRLFHLKLLLFIINYFTLDFFGNLKQFLYVVISCSFIKVIGGY
jgi:hypothetical protein